jgi:hypothetical protein
MKRETVVESLPGRVIGLKYSTAKAGALQHKTRCRTYIMSKTTQATTVYTTVLVPTARILQHTYHLIRPYLCTVNSNASFSSTVFAASKRKERERERYRYIDRYIDRSFHHHAQAPTDPYHPPRGTRRSGCGGTQSFLRTAIFPGNTRRSHGR